MLVDLRDVLYDYLSVLVGSENTNRGAVRYAAKLVADIEDAILDGIEGKYIAPEAQGNKDL